MTLTLDQIEKFNLIKDKISARERKIFEMRHGLFDGTCHTFQDVGQEFGVTRERIRQIEGVTLFKIRDYKQFLSNHAKTQEAKEA